MVRVVEDPAIRKARSRSLKTTHRLCFADAGDLQAIQSDSVHLVVTSPPYPMIEMWDQCFAEQDPETREALGKEQGWQAFERMHALLDRTWKQVHRVLIPGGLACINIGDATRTIGGTFVLYPNHMRILWYLVRLGFNPLPAILWRKQTNAPNKFMGSGMLPAGAYVTLEHEYVLILRKGDKRVFAFDANRRQRSESAFFWEERNHWFSDVWFDLKGGRQDLSNGKTRERSGAFPFELAYRLINMFSVKGDLVLDPFLGTGTTTMAAMASARNSIGYERDPGLRTEIIERAKGIKDLANARIRERLESHSRFVDERFKTHGRFGYKNVYYGSPVITRQEISLFLNPLVDLEAQADDCFVVKHGSPEASGEEDWAWFFSGQAPERPRRKVSGAEALQLDFFQDSPHPN